METIFVGIDPGKGGGIASIVANDVRVDKMPETERDLIDYLRNVTTLSDGACVAMLEKGQPLPHLQRGVISAFVSGKNYGMLRTALVAVGIPFDEVVSVKWQNAMACRTGGDKNITKRRAQDLFPNVRVTHAVADALLLAEYCRRIKTGQLVAAPPPKKARSSKKKKKTEARLF